MRRLCTLMLLFSAYIFCLSGYVLAYEAPPDIVASLPRMCWWQYVPSAKDNPEFNFPGPDCGAYSNHFCPGLVHMLQAERAKDLIKKQVEYNMAKADMQYTIHFTEEYPDCVLRPIAQKNLARINSELELIKILQLNRRRGR